MFTSSAQKISKKTTEWLDYTLFGRSTDQNVTLENTKIDENSLPDGFSIIDTTSSPQNSNLWMTLQRVKDIALGKLESIDLYAVVDGKLAGIVKENVGITDILRLNLGNYSSFALVRDSGLRSKVEELGNVILSGLMPKNGTAEATDVTEEYENFVVGRSVSKEGEADKELGGQGGSKEGEAVEDLSGEGSSKQGETVRTIAAYDISIINDGEEYQPEDKPITVSIQADQIATAVANGNTISLWHLLDDGTAEKVENFTITGDTVVFDATGFSVYVVTETTIEKILTAADGKVYKITVTYDGTAQIPEGAKLIVEEKDEKDYLADTIKALKTKEDYLLYRKFLDISFVTADGEVIEPATPVSVKIELLDVEAGADKLQVVHFGTDGAEKVDSSSTANAVITFSADSFSVFGFGNVLEPLATTETEEAKIELLGFGTEQELAETEAPEVEEGLEVLGSYSVGNEGPVWIKAELKDDVELYSMESVAIYTVNNEVEEVAELAEMNTVTELPTTEFAVVKDSGYRHLSFELNVDEENEGNGEKTVALDGMMPKAAEASAVDVTENYTDHEFTESAPINNGETAPVKDEETGGEEQQEATEEEQENTEGTEEPFHTTNRVTLAAYDISITNRDTDYQPDEEHPVSVVISDSRILQNNNIEIWHIRDDGTEERVEDFTVENGTVSFTATGFSTYAIVYNITTYYQTSTGETYKITVEYGNDAGLPEGVELRVAEVDAEEYLADTAAVLGVDDSYLLYKKFLDISFVAADGEVVEPEAPVSVKIELQDVTAGADKLQVVHFGADGAEKMDAVATEEAVVSFTSSEFSVFGNGLNQYDALQVALADGNPRKDEKIYNVEYDSSSENKANLHFAVELEASFVQTPSGHDNWGHDIIYEFTGDDDFWLYVDGELVIDLGGIHSALGGSVNYATGKVVVNGRNTTLYQLFYDNYVGRGHTAQEALEYVDGDQYPDGLFTQNNKGDWVFKDYTTHTMRIFYMERGGGASNLDMRFNLASVKDGHVELSKKLAGVDNTESLMAEFPYQIWYKKTEDSEEKLLTEDGSTLDIKVFYKNTNTPVTYKPTFTVGGVTYQSVFILKPGEVADIEIPDNAIWYKVIECGLNTDVFHKEAEVDGEIKDLTVEVNEGKETVHNGQLYSATYTYPSNRKDYYIDYAQTRARSRAAFVNSVDPDALRILTIEKHLYDTDGVTELHFDDDQNPDTTTFGFRLSLASELDSSAALVDKYTYHVINPDGVYCIWNAATQRFEPLGEGKTDYTQFSPQEKASTSFKTSMNGSISKIPASYKVEVRELLVGTKYKVEERNYEIPDGYSLRDYFIYADDGDTQYTTISTAAEYTIAADSDPKVIINNLKGFGIRIYKEWNDTDYMEYRAPTYFAVYTGTDDSNLTLVNDTVRQLTQNKDTLYWYFDALNSIPFANYHVREVMLSSDNPTVDSEGAVTNYGTATPISDGGTLTIQGTQKGETGTSPQEYTVDYEQGTPTQQKPNIRVDNITNRREGFVIRKEDWEGNGLGETTFTLKDANYTSGSGLLNATYTSYINPDAATDPDNGYVTTAFLTKDTTYILTETKAKTGYLGLQNPLTITVDSNGDVSVSSETEDADFYVLSDDHKMLTIKNKPFTFTVTKIDKDSQVPLSGAKFELHKQITVGGVTQFDFAPMVGYTDDILVTDVYGVLPKLNETLPAGVYQLKETYAPAGYVKWSTNLEFSLNDVGKITLGSHYPDGTELIGTPKEDDNHRVFYEYILSVPNSADSKWPSLTITKQVTGDMADYDKEFEFTITLHNVNEGMQYDYSIGTETGTVTVDTNHQIKKNLRHGQSLEIARLPLNTEITVAEATGTYTTTWKKDSETVTATTNAITFRLADNTVVEVTNDMPAVAPTGFSTRHTPYLLLLLFGLMLLIGGGVVMKRRRGDDPDDGFTVTINPTPLNTSPQPTYPMNSTTDTKDNIRRNSVWVEETHTSPQMRRTEISCPQAKLWMNSGGGDAG